MFKNKSKTISRVLIADDDPVIRLWLTSILEGEGHSVVSTSDGREAYRLLQSDANFAGAVLDLSMPYLEGSDLTKFMRTEKRLMRIPVMLITAESDIKLVASGLAAGATVLLPKPFTRKRLQQMLHMMLGVSAVSRPAVTKPTGLPTATRSTFIGGSEEEPATALRSGDSDADLDNCEAMPVAEGPVDLSLLANLEDDEKTVDLDLVVELIDLYLGNAAQQLCEIKTAIANKKENLLKQLAHALKGSSLTMGAHSIAQLCVELEQADFQDSNELAKLTQELEKAFASTVEIFKGERQKRVTPVAA